MKKIGILLSLIFSLSCATAFASKDNCPYQLKGDRNKSPQSLAKTVASALNVSTSRPASQGKGSNK